MKLNSILRVTVYCPPETQDIIISAIQEITPLVYGKYEGVVWTSAIGEEQFRPLAGANPTAGTLDEKTTVPSVKVEFSIPNNEALLDRIINEAIIPFHPWETPVIRVSSEREVHVHPPG